jgi:hypothetical protein
LSLPCATGTIRLATAAAAPPLEPPGERLRFHGLRVAPLSVGSVVQSAANSGVLVLPRMTSPALRSRLTSSLSGRSGAPSKNRQEKVVGQPST